MAKEKEKTGGFKEDGAPNAKMVDSLTCYLDSMASAGMNNSSVFDQYTGNFTKIADNNTTLANTAKKQQKELMDL